METLIPTFLKRRLHPTQRYGLRLTLFLFAIALVAVPFVYLLVQVLSKGPLVRLDTAAARNLPGFARRSKLLRSTLELISFFGWPPWFWVLIGGVALNLFIRGRKRLVAFLLSSTMLGSLLNGLVKTAVNRPRPAIERVGRVFYLDKSFPSGHAMTSTIAYGALLLIFIPTVKRRWRAPVIALYPLLVSAIAFSRLALGVHYISDVLGGIVLGLAWLTASTAAFSIWRTERGQEPVHPIEGVEPEAAKDLTLGA
ncbi:MAG: phosphatase PAP2 family protein [Actinomycetota bacterium]|nr:phosphatase PAP2 family protein [Actinomycetota bacterium]